MDKQYLRVDWADRPLTAGMSRNAAEDIRHLHNLVDLSEEKVEEKGRRA